MTRTQLNLFILNLFLLFLGYCANAKAGVRIAILDFELNDFTSLPNTQDELIRTGSLKPMLEQAISQKADYEIIHIGHDEQQSANAGFGYLFRFHDEAAKLGGKFGADWIIVGQHSKPSFLESSLIADVINVGTASRVTELIVDLKGNHVKVTEHAVRNLSEKIDHAILRQNKQPRMNP
jgi:hypothetical protein